MIKTGKEIGIAPIKCEHKEGCVALQKLHTELNSYLYDYSYRLITSKSANMLLGEIERICKIIDKENFGRKPFEKQKEILQKARVIYKSLRDYTKTLTYDMDDMEKIQKCINYQVHKLIEAKGKAEENHYLCLTKSMDEVKELLGDLPPEARQYIKLTTYTKLVEELKEQIGKDIDNQSAFLN